MEIKVEEISRIIRSQIENYDQHVEKAKLEQFCLPETELHGFMVFLMPWRANY
jgi:hypothetical protein